MISRLPTLGFALATISALGGLAHASSVVNWEFETAGKNFSHPIGDGERVYLGSDDGGFYALEASTGQQIWALKIGRPVRSQALLHERRLFLAVGNEVLAVDASSGQVIWRTEVGPESDARPLDLWDYHAGLPAVHGSDLLVGLSNSRVAALDLESGQEKWGVAVEGDAPIKSGLLVDGSILYFGDWNGVAHAHDLRTGNERWSFRSFSKRPYASFGALNSQLTTSGGNLFFGARNDTLHVLDQTTGELVWKHVARDGGWISGDPLVLDGTLYIGGSDNHALLAFDAASGEPRWAFTFLNNCFSKPLPYRDVLLFTTGDAYNVYGDGPGRGYVYAVRRDDGSLVNFVHVGGNLYTTLVLVGDTLVAASEDGKVYGLSATRFLSEPPRLREKGYGVFEMRDALPSPFADSTTIEVEVDGPAEVRVVITDLAEHPVAELSSGILESGLHEITWDGRDLDGGVVDDGYYFVLAQVGDTVLKRFVQKKVE